MIHNSEFVLFETFTEKTTRNFRCCLVKKKVLAINLK